MPIAAQQFVFNCKVLEVQDQDRFSSVFAALVGDEEAVELMEDNDAVIELTCVGIALPEDVQHRLDSDLLVAAAEGDHQHISFCLSEGASVGGIGTVDCALTPTHLATAAHDSVAVDLLRMAGAGEPSMRASLLDIKLALRSGHLLDVVRLLAQRADPDTSLRQGDGLRDTTSGTPLHALCALHKKPGAVAVVALLCRLRANVDAHDNEGDSPLAHAKYFDAPEIYAILEKHGAQVQGPFYSRAHVVGRRYLGWR